MAKEALEIIRETEENARKAVEKAHADAQRLISDAKNAAAGREASLEEEALLRLETARQEARAQAEAEQEAFALQTRRMADELTGKLEDRRERAVEKVIDIVAGR